MDREREEKKNGNRVWVGYGNLRNNDHWWCLGRVWGKRCEERRRKNQKRRKGGNMRWGKGRYRTRGGKGLGVTGREGGMGRGAWRVLFCNVAGLKNKDKDFRG